MSTATTDTNTGDGWILGRLLPALFACWAFLHGFAYMAGVLEFEWAVVQILFVMVVLQSFAIGGNQ